MKKNLILLFLLICSVKSFAYIKEIDELYNSFYMNSGDESVESQVQGLRDKQLDKLQKQIITNVTVVMEVRASTESKRKIYKYLKDNVANNDPLLSEKDPDYLASLADLMTAFVNYATLNELMEYSNKIIDLYDKALAINPNHFPSLLGKAIYVSFMPKFYGGGYDKSMPIFKKAEANAKEDWEKHTTYLWMSQIYFVEKDEANYKKYFDMAYNIFPDAAFVNFVKEENAKGVSLFEHY